MTEEIKPTFGQLLRKHMEEANPPLTATDVGKIFATLTEREFPYVRQTVNNWINDVALPALGDPVYFKAMTEVLQIQHDPDAVGELRKSFNDALANKESTYSSIKQALLGIKNKNVPPGRG